MSLYDGTFFVGLDDDAVGSGVLNAPVDTAIDQALRGNEIFLWEYDDPISFVPYSDHAGDHTTTSRVRPFASIATTTWLTIPWICQRGLKGFRVRLYCRVESPDAGDLDGVFMSLELQGAGVSNATNDLLISHTAGIYSEDHLEWLLDDPTSATNYSAADRRGALGLDRTVEADLNINFRSIRGATQLDTSGMEVVSDALFDGPAASYPSGFGTPYGTDDKSLTMTRTTDNSGGGADELEYDHIYSPATDRMYVRERNNLNVRSAPDADIHTMSYIQIKSLEIQALY